MNPDSYLRQTTKRWTSLLKSYRQEGKITEEFEIILSSMPLEDVIAIKLELSSKTLSSPLYGLPLWHAMHSIVQDAVLKFAISTTRTSSEAARILGLDQQNLYPLIKKYKIYDYFGKIKRREKRKQQKLNKNGP